MAEAVALRSLHDAADEELIEAVRDGDLDAYGVLYYRHCTSAMRIARRWVTSQTSAEDLVSESFTAVLTALRSGAGPKDNFPAYLATAVRNLSARWAERGRRTLTTDDLEYAVDNVHKTPAAEDQVLDLAERRFVAHAFRRLPENFRKVLWFVDVEGHSYAEAAEEMNLNAPAVGALLSRAREMLRDEFIATQIDFESDDSEPQLSAYSDISNPAPTAKYKTRNIGHLTERASSDHPSSLRLSRYARGKTPPRYRPNIERHLSACPRCRVLVREAREVGLTVRTLSAPMLLAPFVSDLAGTSIAAPIIPAIAPEVAGTLAAASSATVSGAAASAASATLAASSTGFIGAHWVQATAATAGTVAIGLMLWAGVSTDPVPQAGTSLTQEQPAAVQKNAPLVNAAPAASEVIHVTWSKQLPTVVEKGADKQLPFTITLEKDVPTTATVDFNLPDGLVPVTQSPTCSVVGTHLRCAGVGPLKAGQQLAGTLVVDAAQRAGLPAVSILPDGSWPNGAPASTTLNANSKSPTTYTPSDAKSVIAAITQPMFGTAAITADGNSVIYTPNNGYKGADGFTVTLQDDLGQVTTSQVGVVVR